MGYLIDINNLLAKENLELSQEEQLAITTVINDLLEDLAVEVVSTAASYANYGAPSAIIAGNAIAELLRSKKL